MMRWWVASVISAPPPSAAPLIAATTGLPSCSSRRRLALTWVSHLPTSGMSSAVVLMTSLRSAPAKKVFLAEVMMTPLMSSFSASSRSTVAPIDSR